MLEHSMDAGFELRSPSYLAESPTTREVHEPVWRQFDASWYLSRYPSVAAQVTASNFVDAEAYYMELGCRLGHSPNMFFDESWYLAAYPDIMAHVAAAGVRSGFAHYCEEGYRTRSPHWLFDQKYYLAQNLDVTSGLLDRLGLSNGYDHYLTFGDEELRSGHRFFQADLFQQNDSLHGGVAHVLAPFMRFLAAGCLAGSTTRVSWYFDPSWYLRAYPEVGEEIEKGWWSSALHHFLCNRNPQFHSPLEWFSEEFYCRTYPDVLEAINNGFFRNGYQHFLSHGAIERRRPHPDVDLASYFHSGQVRSDLGRGEFLDVFSYWLAHAADRTGLAEQGPIEDAQGRRLAVRVAETMLLQFARRKLDFSFTGAATISVIMVVHDQFALTMMALSSLRACSRQKIELILVDSGSHDDTRHINRYISGAEVIRLDRNAGLLISRNIALTYATAQATLYLDNNLTLGINAIELALSRLFSDEHIGAVGGKVIGANGVLQEAGSIIWRDGSTVGYLCGADPNIPEANFVRDVSFCNATFLLLRTSVLKRLGGFYHDHQPAGHEETDLCVRLHKAGYRIVYDPSVVIQHVDHGPFEAIAPELMTAPGQVKFAGKHLDWLRYQYPSQQRNALFARSPRPSRGRILYVEDRIPLRGQGSGYVRSNDIIHVMSQLGYQVTVYPIQPATESLLEMLHELPETAEVLHDRGLEQLPGFIAERAGFYDILWIGRVHNLELLLPIFNDTSVSLPAFSVVLDTEGVSTPRSMEHALLRGLEPGEKLETLLRRELACAYFCQKIVAVSERDAALVRLAGHGDAAVLGHMMEPTPTPAGWQDRSGLLFLGAIHEDNSPNYDSLEWFVTQVLPLLRDRLSREVRFSIAGYINHKVDMSKFGLDSRVDMLGPVDDLSALYDAHRVFVVPTRFAAGMPYKVHEAAAYGMPIVASELICQQVGWADGAEIISGGSNDAACFADRIMKLYNEQDLWNIVRAGALARIEADHGRKDYAARLGRILEDVVAE